jgi:hypothetical protein
MATHKTERKKLAQLFFFVCLLKTTQVLEKPEVLLKKTWQPALDLSINLSFCLFIKVF